jgi:hypothetical protein
MADGLGFPFEVGGPSSGSVTDLGRSSSVITERILRSSGLLAAHRRDLKKGLPRKPGRSPAIWIRSSRSSKVAGTADTVSRPTCRSVELLAGRVHLTGTSRTLVGGDPWVPMSHNVEKLQYFTMCYQQVVGEDYEQEGKN